jgi:LysM repeat protein
MKRNPPVLEGLGVALLVAILVTTGLILTSYENFSSQINTAKNTGTPLIPASSGILTTPSEQPAFPTVISSPTRCPKPDGWVTYVMQSGDSLEALASQRQTDLGEVMGANCLTLPGALPGSTIFLPPPPPTLTSTITPTSTITRTPTITLRPCDYPAGWKRYNVHAGDTLFKLGVRFHISEEELATGNCLSLDAKLQPGDVILILEQPTATPTPRT